ncbi:hypothetical protein NDU88_011317 [Pleurodeles waltl]|uniref:Uncharacterized protein n=1 Tax=Pleurodeles waltl TaxID=8319 RepID=A0AAV7R309_PLEWA|nr:hypothetical protein NDU88_011317 [Pleurodeles waltl]
MLCSALRLDVGNRGNPKPTPRAAARAQGDLPRQTGHLQALRRSPRGREAPPLKKNSFSPPAVKERAVRPEAVTHLVLKMTSTVMCQRESWTPSSAENHIAHQCPVRELTFMDISTTLVYSQSIKAPPLAPSITTSWHKNTTLYSESAPTVALACVNTRQRHWILSDTGRTCSLVKPDTERICSPQHTLTSPRRLLSSYK